MPYKKIYIFYNVNKFCYNTNVSSIVCCCIQKYYSSKICCRHWLSHKLMITFLVVLIIKDYIMFIIKLSSKIILYNINIFTKIQHIFFKHSNLSKSIWIRRVFCNCFVVIKKKNREWLVTFMRKNASYYEISRPGFLSHCRKQNILWILVFTQTETILSGPSRCRPRLKMFKNWVKLTYSKMPDNTECR